MRPPLARPSHCSRSTSVRRENNTNKPIKAKRNLILSQDLCLPPMIAKCWKDFTDERLHEPPEDVCDEMANRFAVQVARV